MSDISEVLRTAEELQKLKTEHKSLQAALIARTAVLLDCRDYFDGRADADQPPDGMPPTSNEELVMLAKIEAVIGADPK